MYFVYPMVTQSLKYSLSPLNKKIWWSVFKTQYWSFLSFKKSTKYICFHSLESLTYSGHTNFNKRLYYIFDYSDRYVSKRLWKINMATKIALFNFSVEIGILILKHTSSENMVKLYIVILKVDAKLLPAASLTCKFCPSSLLLSKRILKISILL